MRKYIIALLSFLIFNSAFATAVPLEPLLNKITLQLSAEQWVTTKNALVSVGVNASVAEIGLDKIQSQILDKLSKISNKGEWHIVSFNRSQDQSGLERVQVLAQARLPNNDLAGIRDRAKSISKPGETYTIDNVQLTPSEDELREANNVLRDMIYQQAKAELARINKNYPEQKYYVHDINFLNEVRPIAMSANALYMKGGESSAPALAVGDQLKVSATVVLAANPDSELAKLIQH